MLNPSDIKRIKQARNLWLATVRPNHTPHLVPIWFVWVNENFYLCTPRSSVKTRNIETNPHVMIALEDGDDPIVIKGTANILSNASDAIVDAFLKKFDWDIRDDPVHNVLIEIVPARVVL